MRFKKRNKLSLIRGNYLIKQIGYKQEKNIIEEIYRLRYKVYCEELHWVEGKEGKKEYDQYDNENAVYFGVFEGNKLVGTTRIILPSSRGFMIQNEFGIMLNRKEFNKYNKNKIVEITRLAVDAPNRGKKNKYKSISNHLYEIMYLWSKKHHIKYWVFVVEYKYYEYLKKSFSVSMNIIGKKHEFSGGVTAIPLVIDVDRLKRIVIMKKIKTSFSKLFFH